MLIVSLQHGKCTRLYFHFRMGTGITILAISLNTQSSISLRLPTQGVTYHEWCFVQAVVTAKLSFPVITTVVIQDPEVREKKSICEWNERFRIQRHNPEVIQLSRSRTKFSVATIRRCNQTLTKSLLTKFAFYFQPPGEAVCHSELPLGLSNYPNMKAYRGTEM
jgi:hypothetical protein